MNINAMQFSHPTNFRAMKNTQNNAPYYESKAGLAVGGTVGALGLGTWATMGAGSEKLEKFYTDLLKQGNFDKKTKEAVEKTIKAYKDMKNKWPIFATVATVCSIGCGIVVDYLRNKKSQQIADKIQAEGADQAAATIPDLDYSNKGNLYYKSREGQKKGAILGAACGLADSIMHKNLSIFNVACFALGGYLCGLITDSIANKNAKKNV